MFELPAKVERAYIEGASNLFKFDRVRLMTRDIIFRPCNQGRISLTLLQPDLVSDQCEMFSENFQKSHYRIILIAGNYARVQIRILEPSQVNLHAPTDQLSSDLLESLGTRSSQENLASLQERNDALFQLHRHTGSCESGEACHRLRVRSICAAEVTLDL